MLRRKDVEPEESWMTALAKSLLQTKRPSDHYNHGTESPNGTLDGTSRTSSGSSTPSSEGTWALEGDMMSSTDDSDDWGHFVEPAEAEQEIVRASKILSRRQSRI